MAKKSQIKGALLEEALLYLLEDSNYQVVRNVPNINQIDPTLENRGNGINVIGRGERHQIDAIANYLSPPRFSYPIRLLCEAKYSSDVNDPVGIDVIRNAVGVRKDVEENFSPNRNGEHPQRYHYQFAVFSSTGFSIYAQRYAYAQDVHLLDLSPYPYDTFVLGVIDRYFEEEVENPERARGTAINANTNYNVDISDLRRRFRGHHG